MSCESDELRRLSQDLFESNKSLAALVRDDELEIVKRAEPPGDLRSIPLEQWDEYLGHDVILPDASSFVIRHSSFPLEEATIHAIEAATEQFHSVTPPYHIYMSPTLQQTGRSWAYIKAAGNYLTGLTLGKK